MGSFDCYCVLCNGPLLLWNLRFGSTDANTQAFMKRKIDNKRRRLRGEDVLDEDSKEWEEKEKERMEAERKDEEMKSPEADNEPRGQNGVSGYAFNDQSQEDEYDDDSDNLSQASDLTLSVDFSADAGDSYDMYGYYGLTRADVQWLDRSRVLAINTEIESTQQAFLSGRGRYNDYGEYCVQKLGKDPLDTRETNHNVCYSRGSGMEMAFPVHEACYKILTRCLATGERKRLDKDVMYGVMLQHTVELGTQLSLDYGPISGVGQDWESHSGEEFSVADPGKKSGIEEVMKSILPASLFDQPPPSPLNLAHKVRHDPMAMLPYDILHGVIVQLPIEDMRSLMTASWCIHEASREAAFWRLMIRVHIVPFFWELESFLNNTTFPENFDWRGAYHWLDDITKPSFGLSGPLIGIANRRRIWNVCLQLAPMYHEMLDPTLYIEPPDTEADSIMSTATTSHTPVTMLPIPMETYSITTQFIRSWSEIKYRPCQFCTYWDEGGDNGLIGIGVNFGSGERVLGSDEGVEELSVHIGSGDWIKEIRVSLKLLGTDYPEERRDSIQGKHDPRTIKDSVIQGMTVYLYSGVNRTVGSFGDFADQRSFAVLPGMQLIGLTGEVTTNGIISRLGLLQASDPSSSPLLTTPTYPPAQLLRWDHKGARMHDRHNNHQIYPMWTHPTRSLYTFPLPSIPPSPSFLHPDMLSHTMLTWAEPLRKYGDLEAISTLQIPDENSKASIIGMLVTQHHTLGNTGPAIGNPGPVAGQLSSAWQKVQTFLGLDIYKQKKRWDEGSMHHFPIDGKGGERVVEVHVSHDHRSFIIVTDRGREGVFGPAGEGTQWHVKKAEQGEVIVGLSACFGTLGGWSSSAKSWSHFALCHLGVVVARGERER